jgi:hypothetical protein
MWEIEEIPDSALLFRRVHINEMDPEDFAFIPPKIFHEIEGGISVDWEKYSTPEASRQRAKNPESICIAAIHASKVRSLEDLDVKHAPDLANRAHSNILGLNLVAKPRRTKMRLKLAEYAYWAHNQYIKE